MEDLGEFGNKSSNKWLKNIVILLLLAYFTGLFVYAINITQRKMPFFTKVVGYDDYQQNGNLNMRFFAVGSKEMAPLNSFSVNLKLLKPSSGLSLDLFNGRAGSDTYINAMVPLPNLQPGNYTAKLKLTHPEYGEEENEFLVAITKTRTPRAVDVQQLDEKLTKASLPIKAYTINPPSEIRFIANNGKVVPNLTNRILVVAEQKETGLPAEGLKISVNADKKAVATLETDENGMAEFSYYPHTGTSRNFKVTVEDKAGKTYNTKTVLKPVGSQVVATPEKYMWPQDQAIRMTLESLRSGVWHIDMFHNGNWISTTREQLHGAKKQVDLVIPKNVLGPVHIQVAQNFSDPTTSYDAFSVFVYDPKTAEISEDDPRLKNADPDDPKWEDLKIEKPFKLLWSYLNSAPQYDRGIIEKWQRKINALSVAEKSYSPTKLAEQILRELREDYYFLPELLDTKETKQKEFVTKQTEDKDQVMMLLIISGALLILVFAFIIFKEMKPVSDDPDLEFSKKNVTALAIILIVVIIGYGMALYLLSILDWTMGV